MQYEMRNEKEVSFEQIEFKVFIQVEITSNSL